VDFARDNVKSGGPPGRYRPYGEVQAYPPPPPRGYIPYGGYYAPPPDHHYRNDPYYSYPPSGAPPYPYDPRPYSSYDPRDYYRYGPEPSRGKRTPSPPRQRGDYYSDYYYGRQHQGPYEDYGRDRRERDDVRREEKRIRRRSPSPGRTLHRPETSKPNEDKKAVEPKKESTKTETVPTPQGGGDWDK